MPPINAPTNGPTNVQQCKRGVCMWATQLTNPFYNATTNVQLMFN